MAKKGDSAPAIKGAGGAKIAIEEWPIERLVPYAANARAHPPAQLSKLRASIREFGFNVPCLVDKDDVLIAGHGRVMAAKEEGYTAVPVIRLEHLTPAQVRAFRLMDNRVQLDSSWLDDLLTDEMSALKALDFDLSLTGFDESEIDKLLGEPGAGGSGAAPKLADKFMIPPFSVLNAREGWWQDRKRAWLALGIQSELGRGNERVEMAHPSTTATVDFYAQKRGLEAELGRELTTPEARALMAQRGTLVDHRAGNAARKATSKTYNDGARLGAGGLADQVAAAATARRKAKVA